MKRRWMIAVALLVVAAAGVALAQRRNAPAGSDGMRTARVTRGDIVISVSATGTVKPASLVEVRSRATGQVTRVLVDEGQRVRKGQVLVELDDPDSRAAVESGRATLQSAEAAAANAQARLAELRAGATVYDRQQAEEAVHQAETVLAQANNNLARQEQLLRDGYVAQSLVDQARHDVQVAESQLRAARAKLAGLQAGATPEQIAQAEAALRQALAHVGETRVNLRQAEEHLAETRITTPISGVVAKRSVDIGQTIIGGSGVGGTLVITLAQVEPLYATVNVDESDIAGIRTGMSVRLTADALPGTVIHGQVEQIAAEAAVVQNVTQFAATVVLQDPPGALRLGMTVDAEFVTARRTNVLLVPPEAVKGVNPPMVTLVSNGELVPRPVKSGLSDGRVLEILEGLSEGDVVFLGYLRQPSTPSPGRSPFTPQFQRRPQQQPRPGGPSR